MSLYIVGEGLMKSNLRIMWPQISKDHDNNDIYYILGQLGLHAPRLIQSISRNVRNRKNVLKRLCFIIESIIFNP